MTFPLWCESWQVKIDPKISLRSSEVTLSDMGLNNLMSLEHSSLFALNTLKILKNRGLLVIAFSLDQNILSKNRCAFWASPARDSHSCWEYRRRRWPDRRLIFTWPWGCHSIATFLALFIGRINRYKWGSTSVILSPLNKLKTLLNIQGESHLTIRRQDLDEVLALLGCYVA